MARPYRRWLVAVAIVLFAAACSATEESGGLASTPDTAARTSERDVVADDATRATTDGTGRTTGPASGNTSALAPGERVSNVGADGRPGKIVTGKGISDETITLGIPYADTGAYNAAGAGLGGVPGFYTPADPKGIQKAVIKYVNDRGGIAGRKVTPVWFELQVANAVTREGRTRDAESACATYTEDHTVFAFWGTGQWTEDNIVECAIRTKTVLIDGWNARTGVWLSEERFASATDYYYTVNGLSTQRREAALVQSLERQGFFTRDAKVGLLIEDTPSIKRGVESSLKPALKALGVDFVERVYPDPIESPWESYVFQFSTAGVTHVIFSSSTAEGWATLLFMRGAENQAWRPRYGISSLPVAWLHSNAPKEQMQNTIGVSWLEGFIGESSPPASSSDRLCREIMKKDGHPEQVGAGFCDFMFLLKRGLEGSTALTPAGFADSVERFGDGFVSTMTVKGRTRFGPKRHYGADLLRDFAFDLAKGRFAFVGDRYVPK